MTPSLTLFAPPPRLSLSLTAGAVTLSLLCLGWSAVDARNVADAPVWMKPLKFALSFAVLFGTLALVEARLSPAVRDGRVLGLTTLLMGTAFVAEMSWIVLQAARGQASHFNQSTPFAAFMYVTVMATGAVLLVLGVAVWGIVAARDRGAAFGPGVRAGILWGFVGSFLLTLVVAGTMSAGRGHFVGTPAPGDPVLPLLGWSGTVGDLRPAHFLSLHMMQALPLLGLWLDRRNAPATGTVRIAAAGYAVVVLAVFAQALAGWPFLPL